MPGDIERYLIVQESRPHLPILTQSGRLEEAVIADITCVKAPSLDMSGHYDQEFDPETAPRSSLRIAITYATPNWGVARAARIEGYVINTEDASYRRRFRGHYYREELSLPVIGKLKVSD